MFTKYNVYECLYKGSWRYVFNDIYTICSKTCLKRPLKLDKTKDLQTDYRLIQVKSIAECSMLPQYFLTCIKPLSVLKTKFWSSFEWPFKTGFTVLQASSFQCLYV